MRRLQTSVLASAIPLWVAAWLCVLAPVGSRAPVALADPPGQIYFTAMMAPKESLADTAGKPNSVYLRWDSVEGEIDPPLEFILYRSFAPPVHITPLASKNLAAVEAELEALYLPADQARRKAEIIAWLNRETPPVDASTFAGILAAKLLPPSTDNALWVNFGSRLAFPLAQVRGLGYRDDTAALPPVASYELVADYDPAPSPLGEVRIGELSIDTLTGHVLPKSGDLEQVTLGRCDGPEVGKDQTTVALSWSLPETHVDKFRNALLTSGYDLYRKTGCNTEDPPWASAPLVDLRADASTAAYDAEGNLILTDLERVNDQPIAVSGGGPGDTEERYKGFNSPYAQFTEAPEQIAAASLEPGDTCPYYLVARDFTGNYGETEELLVTIPDPLPPPAPWVIETSTNFTSGELDIFFDHVNVENYYDDHKRGRSYCNLNTARFDKELRYVPEGQSCDTSAQRRVKLDIVGYNVSRFLRVNDARAFQDSDGDGYSDFEERDPHPLNGFDPAYDDITLPGKACDDTQWQGSYFRADPIGIGQYTIPVAAPFLVQRDSGRLTIEYSDSQPAVPLTEEIYWYRVQSVHADGSLSAMSEPVRAVFHNMARTSREDIDCDFGEIECTHSVEQNPGGDPFAEDGSSAANARWVRISCGSGAATHLRVVEIEQRTGTVRGAQLPPDACSDVAATCSGLPAAVSFLDSAGNVLAEELYSGGLPACPLPGLRLVDDCSPTSTFIDPPPGPNSSASSALGLECPPGPDCYRIYRDVSGQARPLATVCEDDFPVCFDGFYVNQGGSPVLVDCPDVGGTNIRLPNIGGEGICLSLAIVNANNISSSKLRFDCVRTYVPKPGPPQPLDFIFQAGTNQGTISWLPPEQPVLGTLLEYRRKGGGEDPYRRTTFVAHADHRAQDGPLSEPVTLDDPLNPGDPEWEEDWCFRGRTIARADPGSEEDATSEWSTTRCAVRTALDQELPDYLGWPEIPQPPEDDALEAYYLKADGLGIVYLAEVVCSILPCLDPENQACIPDLDAPNFACPCDEVHAALEGGTSFVVYRQERDGAGVASEFYQVSPHVPSAYCSVNDGVFRLDDPYLKALTLTGIPAPFSTPSMIYLDRYPNILGYEYRYQFVYFDSRGEILRYRSSNWISAEAP